MKASIGGFHKRLLALKAGLLERLEKCATDIAPQNMASLRSYDHADLG